MVNCAVRGCRSNLVKSGVRFFNFPADGCRNELWRAFTKRDFFPKYPTICELHFDASQFEPKRLDGIGWRKLKWSAVPTLRPPPSSDHQPSKEHKQESFTDSQIDTSLKLTDGKEFHNAASVTSADTVAEKHLDDQQESEVKASSKKLCSFGVNKDTGTRVVRDKRVLRNLLGTIAENIRNVSFQLQETTNRKCQLMQAVNSLTQEEIMLQRRLKKESDKENVVKQQLQEIDKEDKDLWKEEPCEELDTLIQENHHEDMRTEDWKVDQQCCKDLSAFTEKHSHNGLQIAAQKENDLIAKNILSETSSAKQMELKLFDGLVAFSIVDNVQCVTLKLVSDEDTKKSCDVNPSLLKESTNLTDSSDTAQADDLTMFAESLAEKTDRVECDSFDQSTRAVCSVETSAPPMLLQRHHVCSFCGKHFWNASARQNHEYTHWTEFRCDICDKVFSFRNGLISHKKTHSDEKPFGCTLCDQRFKSNGTLNRHFRCHTGEKHYACSVCSETFFYAHQRQVHMSVHTGKQPFMCQECGRGFSTNSSLTGHMRIHRGEKPYECDICGKRFRQGCQVKAHMEMHGEKPHVCPRCGKRLGTGSIWTHMKQQHSAVKIYYECTVCDKKLSSKQSLEMHMRKVHMGEVPYVCEICYKEFGKHKEFQLHKKEHEPCSS